MNDLTNTSRTGLSRLDTLAQEARSYSEAIALNVMQLGRVFCEARAICPQGQWGEWVQTNTDMSERSAQNIMGIYRRFGGKPAFDGVEKTKLFRMLSLPENTEEQFMAEHDVKGMSTRELEEAVKQARDEERQKAEKQRKQMQMDFDTQLKAERAKADAELNRLATAKREEPQADPEQIRQLKEAAAAAIQQNNATSAELSRLKHELDDANFDL